MNELFEHILSEFKLPLSNPVFIFSLILFIILLSPILLKRLNIPGIIGLIISGVIIGPYGLNILENNSAIDLFSTIGLLYIMFIAGLELDMNEFKAFRNRSFLFGFLTFIIPIGIGFPLVYFTFGYDFNASLLTASMFATHTLVAYPIVSKLGVAKNQAVAVTVGGTIFADTAVLLLLEVIVGNHNGNISQEFWIKLCISLLIFVIIMFFIIPRIAKWFFQKLESEKHAHYIFVLSVVFFSAFLAQLAGVEPIIGAFVAGLALNRLIPQSSALMNRIEFIGNSLFIPFFLISVGMLVNFAGILEGPMAIVIALALTAIALISKWIAAYFTQKILQYSEIQRNLIFGLSSSRVAATIAVILVGYNVGILDENILNGTIILVFLTCIVASIVTENAGKKMLIAMGTDNQNSSLKELPKSETILIPIAKIVNIEKLLDFALLVKDKNSPNPISLLTVVPNDETAEANIINSKKELEKCVHHASAYEVKVNIIATIDHNAASGIARTSREIAADIVIIGWPHKTFILEKIIGEKIDSIIENLDKMLFVCNITKPILATKRIVVIAPPLTEKEIGFDLWLSKLSLLSIDLSIPIAFYGNVLTQEAIKKKIKKLKLRTNALYNFFNDWHDFFNISDQIDPDDLIVLPNSRKGSVSHINILDNLPSRIEKNFESNSKIIIYPQQINPIKNRIEDSIDDIL